MRNPGSCTGGKEENDGMLVEEIAVKDPEVWSKKDGMMST